MTPNEIAARIRAIAASLDRAIPLTGRRSSESQELHALAAEIETSQPRNPAAAWPWPAGEPIAQASSRDPWSEIGQAIGPSFDPMR